MDHDRRDLFIARTYPETFYLGRRADHGRSQSENLQDFGRISAGIRQELGWQVGMNSASTGQEVGRQVGRQGRGMECWLVGNWVEIVASKSLGRVFGACGVTIARSHQPVMPGSVILTLLFDRWLHGGVAAGMGCQQRVVVRVDIKKV